MEGAPAGGVLNRDLPLLPWAPITSMAVSHRLTGPIFAHGVAVAVMPSTRPKSRHNHVRTPYQTTFGRSPRPCLPPLVELVACYVGAISTFGPDALAYAWCIQATRVAELVFSRLDVPVTLQVVDVTLRNAASLALDGHLDHVAPAGQHPAIMLCGHRWRDDPALTSGSWYAHLVPLIGGRHLVDAAIRQCQREHAGLLTPLVLHADAEATLTRGRALRLRYEDAGTVTEILYEPREPDPGICRLPAWKADPGSDSQQYASWILAEMMTALQLMGAPTRARARR